MNTNSESFPIAIEQGWHRGRKQGFFQPPNHDILKSLEMLLHSNITISDSDNTEVAEWRV